MFSAVCSKCLLLLLLFVVVDIKLLMLFIILNAMFQVAEGAKSAGASRIIGIDIDSKKFDVGK